MKYVHQFLIIMTISFIGELLGLLLPLPIPASVYGLAIMLICLFTRVIKLNQIEEVADWLILIKMCIRDSKKSHVHYIQTCIKSNLLYIHA